MSNEKTCITAMAAQRQLLAFVSSVVMEFAPLLVVVMVLLLQLLLPLLLLLLLLLCLSVFPCLLLVQAPPHYELHPPAQRAVHQRRGTPHGSPSPAAPPAPLTPHQ
jgi:hypothetical protein